MLSGQKSVMMEIALKPLVAVIPAIHSLMVMYATLILQVLRMVSNTVNGPVVTAEKMLASMRAAMMEIWY